MEDLLEACGAVIDRPQFLPGVIEVGESSRAPERTQVVRENSRPDLPGANELFLASLNTLVKQNSQLLEQLSNKEDSKRESQLKKRNREENYSPEEPVTILEESYRIKDDGLELIDFGLRQGLRPINADPASYWVKGTFRQVDRPILGATLYTEHIMPGSLNKSVACKMSDRCAHLDIKNFLSKNSGVGREAKKSLKVTGLITDEFCMGLQTDWTPADSVWEVVDGGFNLLCGEHMIRQYSYTAIVMFRCLHEIRYFCGVTERNPKLQRTLIESFYNECLKVSCIR